MAELILGVLIVLASLGYFAIMFHDHCQERPTTPSEAADVAEMDGDDRE